MAHRGFSPFSRSCEMDARKNIDTWRNGLRLDKDPEAGQRKYEYILNVVRFYLKRYPVSEMNDQQYIENLTGNFKILNQIISRKRFMYSPKTVSLADFALFPILQGFLAVD